MWIRKLREMEERYNNPNKTISNEYNKKLTEAKLGDDLGRRSESNRFLNYLKAKNEESRLDKITNFINTNYRNPTEELDRGKPKEILKKRKKKFNTSSEFGLENNSTEAINTGSTTQRTNRNTLNALEQVNLFKGKALVYGR